MDDRRKMQKWFDQRDLVGIECKKNGNARVKTESPGLCVEFKWPSDSCRAVGRVGETV